MTNGGDMSIVDYIITDTMPNPYVFTGPVSYTIYGSDGTSQSSGTLFTISTSPDNLSNLSELSESTLASLSVQYSKSNGTTTTVDVPTDGTWVDITNTKASFKLRFYFDTSGNLVMEIDMEDAVLAIPEGGKIEITYTSWNPTTTQASVTYINQVALTPTQSFSLSDIQSGTAVTDTNGDVVGVSTISPVTVAAGYATSSYKAVAETATNSATSESSSNSIALSAVNSTFTYTMHVENVNDVAITKLVLIDNLPYVGDTYTYNDDLARDSEFDVILADTDFIVVITDSSGNIIQTLAQGTDYTVEYSSTVKNFSDAGRDGTSAWTDISNLTDLSDAKSIRVTVNTEIPAGATVSVSFNAVVKNPSGVNPGDVAWNNFGYQYKVTGLNNALEAMTLAVGVKVPSAPELTKELIDLEGKTHTAEEDVTFTFVVYQGEELKDSNNESYKTQAELIAALDLAQIEYHYVTATVEEGDSKAKTLIFYGDYGLSNGETWWNWVDGERYTIAEFTEDGNYVFKEWYEGNTKLTEGNSYTFTYSAATTIRLTYRNAYEPWNLNLTKVEMDNPTKVLEGAVFALYTTNDSEKMSDDDYAALTDKPDQTLTVGTDTWYLMSVETTGATGTITWSDLKEDSYYLVEIKAPDGYNINSEPTVVTRKQNSNNLSVTVENKPGYAMPYSGGNGTIVNYVAGSMILVAAGILLLRRRKKHKVL